MVDPRFKNVEFKVGMFVTVAILIIGGAFIFVGINKQVFTPKITIYIKSSTGDGLKKNMPVLFSGFQISRIESITLQDDGNVVMMTKIPTKYSKWIKKDSVAKLVSQNIIGSTSIVFEGGSGENIKEHQEFYVTRDKGLNEIIEKAKPVMDDLKVIVENIRVITEKFSDEEGDFNNFIKGLGTIGNDLQNKQGSLGYLLRSDFLKEKTALILSDISKLQLKIEKIADETFKITTTTKQKISQFEINNINKLIGSSEKMIEEMSQSIKKLDPIFLNVTSITEDIKKTTDNLTTLRNEADFMLNTTNRLMLNLEEKWPFSDGGKTNKGELKIP